MALPHLIKYVYTNGTDEVIRRGKKIHAIGYVELIEYDELFESVPSGSRTTVIPPTIKFLFRNSGMQNLFRYVAAVHIILVIFAGMKQPH